LILDVGALLGSLVGQSEANLRQALRTLDAMAPAVCMVDELEKALAGVGSAGDSGVSSRLFGTLLTYLSDHTSDVFLVATSNDISKLPPELARAERFDGVFFLDLPAGAEKEGIWDLYRRQFGIPEDQARPDDRDWTGAEIRSCCRLAALLGVPLAEAAQHVVPVAVTAAEQVERLRCWASGRCLSASTPGIYRRNGEEAARPGRRVQRGPSSN
jgi:SpoVK/Ycf46/Vps4 family AAA+-type ATPase